MSDDPQQTNQDRSGQEDAILPGLGIVAGILVGVVLWECVEGWITLGPAGLWVAQGAFVAVCVLVASMIDGLIRPRDWSWRNRIRNTLVFAVGVVAWWGSAAIGHAIAGETAATIGWLVAFLVLVVVGWILRRRPPST